MTWHKISHRMSWRVHQIGLPSDTKLHHLPTDSKPKHCLIYYFPCKVDGPHTRSPCPCPSCPCMRIITVRFNGISFVCRWHFTKCNRSSETTKTNGREKRRAAKPFVVVVVDAAVFVFFSVFGSLFSMSSFVHILESKFVDFLRIE